MIKKQARRIPDRREEFVNMNLQEEKNNIYYITLTVKNKGGKLLQLISLQTDYSAYNFIDTFYTSYTHACYLLENARKNGHILAEEVINL